MIESRREEFGVAESRTSKVIAEDLADFNNLGYNEATISTNHLLWAFSVWLVHEIKGILLFNKKDFLFCDPFCNVVRHLE